MREHEFTLVLTTDPNDGEADRLYGRIDDGTLATVTGVPQIHFQRAATSLAEAIRAAIRDVRATGLEVTRVEIEPDSVLQPT